MSGWIDQAVSRVRYKYAPTAEMLVGRGIPKRHARQEPGRTCRLCIRRRQMMRRLRAAHGQQR